MINKYSYFYNADLKVSEHFQVKEFASKKNGILYSDTILIDSLLVDMLEQLFKALECSKIIITSGYRTSNHDKSVGGTGTGKHVEGMAADIICYDKAGKIINSKYVCCAAQDLGIKGIAKISANATHIDTRTIRYYGDETVSLNTVTNDFYEYFGIKKINKEVEEAINVLAKKDICDATYWISNYDKENCVQYVGQLIKNMATYINSN